ncbi:MAG: nucleotidyltransferase family protein [bacterium]|nr:nucleotidyltransferase family protein [bacterium]
MQDLKKMLIAPDIPIKKALKQMDEAAGKILFVVDDKDRLLGTITDGDIRRWIIKGKSLDEAVDNVMNRSPLFLQYGYDTASAKKIMIGKKIETLPVLNDNKQIIRVINWLDLFETSFKKHGNINLPVVIMAGGEGTRLAPFTKVLPKPLLPIGEQPIIGLIIDKFFICGCQKFFLSVNYKANLIKAYFDDFKHKYDINYLQEEKPLGTAGSLRLLTDKIKTTFFVTNCDILIEADYADIFKYHRRNKNMITLVGSMKHYVIPYGVCDISQGGNLKGLREKPEYDLLVNTGLYIIEPEILNLIPRNKQYHITDLINDSMRRGKKVGVYPVSEKSWLDMGQWDAFKEMLKQYGV